MPHPYATYYNLNGKFYKWFNNTPADERTLEDLYNYLYQFDTLKERIYYSTQESWLGMDKYEAMQRIDIIIKTIQIEIAKKYNINMYGDDIYDLS